jgi:hypothetical protein
VGLSENVKRTKNIFEWMNILDLECVTLSCSAANNHRKVSFKEYVFTSQCDIHTEFIFYFNVVFGSWTFEF